MRQPCVVGDSHPGLGPGDNHLPLKMGESVQVEPAAEGRKEEGVK